MTIKRINKIVKIDGKIINAVYEIDTEETAKINKHMQAIATMKNLIDCNLSSSKNSTLGKGKSTGSMSRAGDARNFKGNKTRTASRKSNADRINSHDLEIVDIASIRLNQF